MQKIAHAQLLKKVGAIVAGAAVHGKAYRYAQLKHPRHLGNAACKLHIGYWAMRNAAAAFGYAYKLIVRKMYAVGIPNVAPRPAERFNIVIRLHAEMRKGIVFLVLRFRKVRMQPKPQLPRKQRALLHQLPAHGKGRARRERKRAHGAEGSVVILRSKAAAVLKYFVNRLYNAVRRQPAVFFGKIHAAAACGKAHAQRVRRAELFVYQKMACGFGENIVVVKGCCAAPFHKLRHGKRAGAIYYLAVYALPNFIKGL